MKRSRAGAVHDESFDEIMKTLDEIAVAIDVRQCRCAGVLDLQWAWRASLFSWHHRVQISLASCGREDMHLGTLETLRCLSLVEEGGRASLQAAAAKPCLAGLASTSTSMSTSARRSHGRRQCWL